jgi:hypothetical protein
VAKRQIGEDMPRVKIYDAEDLAKDMVRTFNDREVEREEVFSPSFWPLALQHVGDSLGVAYSSDKWEPKDDYGRREMEKYKHIAESRNRAFLKEGLLVDADSPSSSWPVYGDLYDFEDVPMPGHFAVLGLFLEINLQLYTHMSKGKPCFSFGDQGIVATKVRHGMVGGSKIRWSKVEPGAEDELFLFVYTRSQGVLAIVVGDELAITKDGIAG